jgi:hypothetical protein
MVIRVLIRMTRDVAAVVVAAVAAFFSEKRKSFITGSSSDRGTIIVPFISNIIKVVATLSIRVLFWKKEKADEDMWISTRNTKMQRVVLCAALEIHIE